MKMCIRCKHKPAVRLISQIAALNGLCGACRRVLRENPNASAYAARKFPFGTSTEDRFWGNVNKKKKNECWEWQGHVSKTSKGQIWDYEKKRQILVTRYSYELHFGKIRNSSVTQKCKNNKCVNPNHLALKPNKYAYVSSERISTFQKKNKSKTHCKRGHKFTKSNTLWYSRKQLRADGSYSDLVDRKCRTCNQDSARKYQQNIARKKRKGLPKKP